MSIVFPEAAEKWLESTLGAAFDELVVAQIEGGTSSQIFQIHRSGAHTAQFVLRIPNDADWIKEEPDLIVHEAAALQYAQKAGLRAPRLIAHSAGEEFGSEAPVILTTKLAGRVELRPSDFSGWLRALAAELADIHRNTARGFAWEYSSWVEPKNLFVPEWATASDCWVRAFKFWHQGPPEYFSVFLHRDYHPVNVLWRGEEISGVVDWPGACRGPAGVDVGHCRINLAQMYGLEAADRFLDYYCEAAAGFVYHPYWDLDTVFDWCIPEPEYYPPWKYFGLGELPPQVLRQRVEEYLLSVCKRF